MDLVGDCSRLLANFFLVDFDRSFRVYVQGRGCDFMRFADDMVVHGSTRQECEELVFKASGALHELGLNINVAKVRYCSKEEFQRFWGFAIMDQFEAGNLVDGLIMLRGVIDEDTFGRRSTALKRAITVVGRDPGGRVGFWRQWVRNKALEHRIPMQLSSHQLLSFIRLYEDTAQALRQLIPVFLNQPFTQPKAILVRALEQLRGTASVEVRTLCTDTISEIERLGDPVLSMGIANMP
jgi:hypothetical protein